MNEAGCYFEPHSERWIARRLRLCSEARHWATAHRRFADDAGPKRGMVWMRCRPEHRKSAGSTGHGATAGVVLRRQFLHSDWCSPRSVDLVFLYGVVHKHHGGTSHATSAHPVWHTTFLHSHLFSESCRIRCNDHQWHTKLDQWPVWVDILGIVCEWKSCRSWDEQPTSQERGQGSVDIHYLSAELLLRADFVGRRIVDQPQIKTAPSGAVFICQFRL